jgi:outer membrane receptor for ferric coprogen and ferric-rhodotorulic acid
MCIEYKLTTDKKKKILDKIGREGIKVYKIVRHGDWGHYPIYRNKQTPYEEGVNTAQRIQIVSWDAVSYMSGFHFYMNKYAAKMTLKYEWEDMDDGYQYKIIECIVKKSWVTTIGEEYIFNDDGRYQDLTQVIITKKAIFPVFAENKTCV